MLSNDCNNCPALCHLERREATLCHLERREATLCHLERSEAESRDLFHSDDRGVRSLRALRLVGMTSGEGGALGRDDKRGRRSAWSE